MELHNLKLFQLNSMH